MSTDRNFLNRKKKFTYNVLPFLLSMIPIHLAWRHHYFLLILYSIVLAGYIFTGKDKILELKLGFIGIIWGLGLEIIGVRSGFHTFNAPDFMSMPLWLAVIWGLGFVLGKRISLIFIKKSPWYD